MGCASSTQVSGDGSKKHSLGGSYPGNRRPQHPAHVPNEFQGDGTATAHFISYGGGNALVQQQHGGPQMGGKAKYVSVTLPQNVHAGQTIHVQAPDGRLNEIVVPQGFGPGSTFTVEFMDEKPSYNDAYADASSSKPTKPESAYNYNNEYATATPAAATATATTGGGDDGFATGFNNPNFTPTATVGTADPEINYNAYPAASDAKPVYSSAPSYPASKPY